jgi:hypothetical protein
MTKVFQWRGEGLNGIHNTGNDWKYNAFMYTNFYKSVWIVYVYKQLNDQNFNENLYLPRNIAHAPA